MGPLKRTAEHDLLERVWPVVTGVVRRTLGAGDRECEDVRQVVLERLLAGHRGVAPERLTAWAAAVARNVAVDALRARSRERRTLTCNEDDAAGAAYGIDPERLALARERLLRYASAVAGLPTGYAEVVYMHDVLGHELAQIATVLAISTAAAQSRLVRGRKQIAARLKAE